MNWPTDVGADGTAPPIIEVGAESADLMQQCNYVMKIGRHIDRLGMSLVGFQVPTGAFRLWPFGKRPPSVTVPLLAAFPDGRQSFVYTNCFDWNQTQIRRLRAWIGILFGDGSTGRHITVVGEHSSAVPALMYGISRFVHMSTVEAAVTSTDVPIAPKQMQTSAQFFGRELADDCVAMFGIRDFRLDYTPASLAVLDKTAAWPRGYKLVKGEKLETLLGCYFGELVCRHLEGTWRDTLDTQMAGTTASPVVVSRTGGQLVDAIATARTCFERKPRGGGFAAAFTSLSGA